MKAFDSASLMLRDQKRSDALLAALGSLQAIENELPYAPHKKVRDPISVGVYDVIADFGQARGTNTATILPNDARLVQRYGRTILMRRNILVHPTLIESQRRPGRPRPTRATTPTSTPRAPSSACCGTRSGTTWASTRTLRSRAGPGAAGGLRDIRGDEGGPGVAVRRELAAPVGLLRRGDAAGRVRGGHRAYPAQDEAAPRSALRDDAADADELVPRPRPARLRSGLEEAADPLRPLPRRGGVAAARGAGDPARRRQGRRRSLHRRAGRPGTTATSRSPARCATPRRAASAWCATRRWESDDARAARGVPGASSVSRSAPARATTIRSSRPRPGPCRRRRLPRRACSGGSSGPSNHRSIEVYRELFTTDYQFVFAALDSAGNAYRAIPFTREDEIESMTNLLAPAATDIRVELDRNFNVFARSAPRPGSAVAQEHPDHIRVQVDDVGRRRDHLRGLGQLLRGPRGLRQRPGGDAATGRRTGLPLVHRALGGRDLPTRPRARRARPIRSRPRVSASERSRSGIAELHWSKCTLVQRPAAAR